ncbi:MAG: ketoacyl-ACP synthase III [Calditrichaeota bacterium]|nr:MAG: ketoacyl-ACP synthase III [Calditrichota bacterium]
MVLGTGKAVPERILTNHDLEKMVDTSDEWIRTRTGIERRHIANDHTRTSELASTAAQAALADAGLSAEEIDVILVGTVTGDATFPATACYVQEKIGAVNAAAMDLQAACSGFLYGTAMADSLITAGKAKHVLVIGAELLSRITDWTDRSTCVLFGDGAGAAVFGPAQDSRGVIDTFMKSDGRLTHLLYMIGGGSSVPMEIALQERLNYLKMEGPEVFKAAVTAMGDAAAHILERNGMTGEDIDLLIPHQANIRIIRATAKRLKMPEEKVYINVNEFGNTSAASIPIAITEAREKGLLKPGDTALLVAFGGGLTWSSVIIRF